MGPRRFIVSVGALALVALVPLTPRIIWSSQPEHRRTVVIVDKTVASADDYSEHAGLTWLLNHERIVQGAGNRDPGERFSAATDYAGHVPGRAKLRALKIEPASADLVYVADTYGVYAETARGGDPDRVSGSNRPVRRAGAGGPQLIHGGLQPAEVATIQAGLRPGGLLVAEFNTLASPTGDKVRESFGTLMGVRSTGWIGRRFASLALGGDLPGWVREGWERRTRRTWAFAGGGYVLTHRDGRIVVLEEGTDIARRGLTVQFERAARKRWGVAASTGYEQWFEIVTPRKQAKVVARYRLQLRKPGAAKLASARLPAEFPAVVTTAGTARNTIYFAGDWVDVSNLPDSYQRAGAAWWQARTTSGNSANPRAFFWHVFVPLLRAELEHLE